MKLGISSYAFGWAVGFGDVKPSQPLMAMDLLERAIRLDAQVLQIADNLAPHTLSPADRNELVARAAEQEITIEIGARGLTQKHLETYIALAEDMNAPLLRFLIDGFDYHPDLSEVVPTLRQCVPHLKHTQIAIENHDRFRAVELQRLMEEVDSEQVGICLDVANSLGIGEGVETVTERLALWVVNLHVKDVAIRRIDTLMGFVVEGCPAGQGVIDIPWVIGQMSPRCQSIVLESWTPQQVTLEQTIELEATSVEQGYRYLSQLCDTGSSHD